MRELICALVSITMLASCGGGGSMMEIPLAFPPPARAPVVGGPDQGPVTEESVPEAGEKSDTEVPVSEPAPVPVAVHPIQDIPGTVPDEATSPGGSNPVQDTDNLPETVPVRETVTGRPALGIDEDQNGNLFVRFFLGTSGMQTQSLDGLPFQVAGDLRVQSQSTDDSIITLPDNDDPQMIKIYNDETGSITLKHRDNSVTIYLSDEGKSWKYPTHDLDSIVGNVTAEQAGPSERYYYLGEKPVKVVAVEPPPAPTTPIPIGNDRVRHHVGVARVLQVVDGEMTDLDTGCETKGIGCQGDVPFDLNSYEGYGNWGKYYLYSVIKSVNKDSRAPLIAVGVAGYPSNSLPDIAPNITDLATQTHTFGETLTYTGAVAGRIATPGDNFGRRVSGRAELTYQINAIADKHGLPVQNYHWDRAHPGANIVGPWMTAEFTNMKRVNGTKEYPDHDWGNIPEVYENGTFKKEDLDNRLYGQFYGPNHEEIAGVYELHTEGDAILGAFGTSPRR